MSSFFSLGGKNQDQHPQTDNNHSFFLFKNEEIYNKSFELWQHQYHLHQQRLHLSQPHSITQDVDFSIGPSRRNSNNINSGNNIGNELSIYSNYRSAGFRVMSQGRGRNDSVNCQDCGNQAKKDCAYMRCRTCCKSRGFHCQTHVNSTWVPATKRRERQQQVVIRGETPKRLREINPGGGGGSGSGGGGFELSNLPQEVNSSAVFRCVRVTAMDEAEEHLAYQTAVNIGGHLFKGILYDQGVETRYPSGGGESSSGGGGSQQQPLDLIAAAAAEAGTSGATSTSSLNAAMIDPSIYPTQYGGFMAGTQFFLPPRP